MKCLTIRPPPKKLFGCTPPTDPMFEAYPNLFFFILNQKITKLTKKRQKKEKLKEVPKYRV